MRRISMPAGIRCGKRREQGRIKTVPEWRNWQTRQVQDLVLAREWRFESSFGHHTNQSKSSLPNPLLPLNLLRVQFIFPILYLLARTAFATLGNSVIFGVLHAKARQRPRILSFSGQVGVAQDEQRGKDPQQQADFAPLAGRNFCERIGNHAQT